MHYIIYCRKSSESEDRQVMSLDAQEQELLNLAHQNNLKIIKIFRESMSAKEAGRPQFNDMIKMIRSGKAQGVLCWKLDRLARNFIDGGPIIDLLQKGTLQEIRTHEAIHSPQDNVLLLAVHFGMANQYIRDLSENVKRGNREKLRRGEWPNHAPFGYLNDRATKTAVPDPQRKQFVVRMYDLYANQGYSYQQIADICYGEGLRTSSGRKVLKSTVERVLKKHFYYGMMERDGIFYLGKHEPLISKEMFDHAKIVREGASRPRPKNLFFTYRGIMTCSVCGCMLTASRKKGKYDYYYCTNGKGICDQHRSYLREEDVDAHFINAFNQICFDEELVDIMYEAAKERIGHNDNSFEENLAHFDRQLEHLNEKEVRLLDSYTSSFVGKELYEQEAKKLKNEKTLLEQQKHKYSQKSDKGVATLELTKQVFLDGNKAISVFSSSDSEKKREIVQKLLWNLQIKDKEVAQYSFISPYNILAKTPKDADFSTLLRD